MNDLASARRMWQQLETPAHDLIDELAHITGILTRHHYADTSEPKGPVMSLATIAADARNFLGSLQANAQADYNGLKAFLEEKLPEVERVGSMLDSDPLVQLAMSELVPAPLRQIAADAVSSVVKAFQAAPVAPVAETPAEPAEPAA